MKYYYMDENEIAIRTKIKNLTAISTNLVKDTGLIFLTCTMESGLTLSLSSRHKHFPLFLDTLSSVYEREKDKRNIIIFDDYTEDLLREKYQHVYREIFDEHEPFENAKIDYQRYDLNSLMPIISEILSIMYAIEGVPVEEFISLTGIRDYFTLRIKVFGKEKLIPIKFMKKDDFSYNIILGNVYGPRSINASIDFLNEGINIFWDVAGAQINGTIKFTIESSVKEVIDVIHKDQYIYYNEKEYKPLEDSNLPQTIKQDYPGYALYSLDNKLFIAVSRDNNKSDIHYISDVENIKKTRICYKEESDLDGVMIPLLSSKKVIEEYRIDDNLSLIQEFFTYIPYEGEYYNEVLQNKVQFKIIEDGITYYPKDQDSLGYIKSLDASMMRKVVEEMKK